MVNHDGGHAHAVTTQLHADVTIVAVHQARITKRVAKAIHVLIRNSLMYDARIDTHSNRVDFTWRQHTTNRLTVFEALNNAATIGS
jgi:hypothetical protein